MTEPAAKRPRLDLGSSIMVFCVGEEETEIPVHETLVTKSALTVRDIMMRDSREEARTKRYPLKDKEVTTVKGYVNWLYTGEITTVNDKDGNLPQLVKLFLLGSSLVDNTFCNDIMDFLVYSDKVSGFLHLQLTQLVWKNLGFYTSSISPFDYPDDPLCLYLLGTYYARVKGGPEIQFETKLKGSSTEQVIRNNMLNYVLGDEDVLEIMREKMDPKKQPRCKFHTHDYGEECGPI